MEILSVWHPRIRDDSSQELYAVEYDEIHVGKIGLKNIDTVNKKAKVWVYLGNLDYRGKGIAKRSLLRHMSIKSGVFQKFYAYIADFNYPSLRTFSSAGFHTEALLPKELYFKGQFVNIFRLYKLT